VEKMRVSALSIGPAVDQGTAQAFNAELALLWNTEIDWNVSQNEPAAAGFSEISNIVSFLADSKELIVPVASALAGRFSGPASTKFRDVLSRCRRNPVTGRPYVPMMIGFGTNPRFSSVRFYFYREVDADELNTQLKEMVALLETLPEEAFMSSTGPMENGFFWDHEQQRWRENYATSPLSPGNRRDPWFPEKVFDDWA
jgi:hypothetical protein